MYIIHNPYYVDVYCFVDKLRSCLIKKAIDQQVVVLQDALRFSDHGSWWSCYSKVRGSAHASITIHHDQTTHSDRELGQFIPLKGKLNVLHLFITLVTSLAFYMKYSKKLQKKDHFYCVFKILSIIVFGNIKRVFGSSVFIKLHLKGLLKTVFMK